MGRPRYTVIQADAVDVLPVMPLKVLLIIGTHTNNMGWCRVNQRKLGERLGVSRETVNRAIRQLCKAGFLEKHDLRAKGQNICTYRVVMDRGMPDPEEIEPMPDEETGADLVTSGSQGVVTPGSQGRPPCDGQEITTPCDALDVTTQRPIGTTIKKHSSLRSECKNAGADAPVEPKGKIKAPPQPGSCPERKATRLPEDWQLPTAWSDWTHGEFAVTAAEIADAAASFRDYWCGKPGADARKLDWLATWRNWCRREFRRKRRATVEPQAALTPEQRERKTWEFRLKAWDDRGRVNWPRDKWGAAPGEPGCQAPPDLLRAHGFSPVALVA